MTCKKCSHCDRKYYIKVKRYLRPLLAPVTHAQELEQELENITGESYIQVKINYCPICGRKVKGAKMQVLSVEDMPSYIP